MADQLAPLDGRAALDFASQLLSLKVAVSGLEHVPPTGPVVILANHPTGIGDGVAVYDALKVRRPDMVFYANADAHRVCPGFHDTLIPVEWVEAKRNRERARLTLTRTAQAFAEERAIMIFPAGRMSRRDETGRFCDPPWAPTAFSVARKAGAPLVPAHLSGPWSRLFNVFHDRSPELRDITLFHELLNKQGKAFSLIIGEPIAPTALPSDPPEAIQRLKDFVEGPLAAGQQRFS
jgi:putative hemolysin